MLKSGTTYEITIDMALPPQSQPVQIESQGKVLATALPGAVSSQFTLTSKQIDLNLPLTPVGQTVAMETLQLNGEGWVPGGPDVRRLGAYVLGLSVCESGTPVLNPNPPLPTPVDDFDSLITAGKVALGDGMVITIDTSNISALRKCKLVKNIVEQSGTLLGHPEWNAKWIDNGFDGIHATRFDDKILYYNPTREDRVVELKYRESDWEAGQPKPANLSGSLTIPARTILDVPLEK
jgi:hypothetical protein